MSTPPGPDPALSFAGVADAYERARPAYPAEAVAWLVGPAPARVVELGAGTGKLTAQPARRRPPRAGHRPARADAAAPALRRCPEAVADPRPAEQIPVRGRWADVVVGAQAFHWFDRDPALPEIARVLRPGGHIALAWNVRDERIPWVQRLGRLIDRPREQDTDPTQDAARPRNLFGFVEQATFRFWQPLDRPRLRDLVRVRSHIAVMDEPPSASECCARSTSCTTSYGRGADGMLLPYVTHCFRAVVRAQAEPDERRPAPRRSSRRTTTTTPTRS